MQKKSLTLIKGGVLQNPNESEQKKNVLIQGDKIVDITDETPDNTMIVDAEGCFVTPGLIDQHLHGGYGCNFNTADPETIINFLTQLPKHGITSVCPTIMTDTPKNIKEQIEKIKDAKAKLPAASAKIVGINLEGPFINPEFKGAHPEELCLQPTVQNYRELEDDLIKIITIAPELDENFELTKYLAGKGVIISAGHSNADREVFLQAVAAGLRQVTHIFNAMPPLCHRTPGIIGNSLVNDEVCAEVIADHHHLHPDIVKLILRSKPEDKVILISDSLPLAHSNEDSAIFGGQKIFKKGGIAVNEAGNFAGSLMFLDAVIRKNLAIASFSKLLTYCVLNPAQNLKLKDTGYLAKGMNADITLWNTSSLEIKSTFTNGHQVF